MDLNNVNMQTEKLHISNITAFYCRLQESKQQYFL